MKKPVLCMGAPSALVELFRMVLKEVSLELEVKLPDNYIKPGTYAFVIIDTRSARGWRAALKALVEQKEKVVLIFGRTQPRTEVMDNALRQGAAAVIGAKYKKNEDPAALIRAVLQNAEVLPRREHCPLIATMTANFGSASFELRARLVSKPGVLHTVAEALQKGVPVLVTITMTGSVPAFLGRDVEHFAVDSSTSTRWQALDGMGLNWIRQLRIREGSEPWDTGDAKALLGGLLRTIIAHTWDCSGLNTPELVIAQCWIHQGVHDQAKD